MLNKGNAQQCLTTNGTAASVMLQVEQRCLQLLCGPVTHPLSRLFGVSLRQLVQTLLLHTRYLSQLSITRSKFPAGSSRRQQQ
jgi:hypothetical protein